jgi:hypothetical protein
MDRASTCNPMTDWKSTVHDCEIRCVTRSLTTSSQLLSFFLRPLLMLQPLLTTLTCLRSTAPDSLGKMGWNFSACRRFSPLRQPRQCCPRREAPWSWTRRGGSMPWPRGPPDLTLLSFLWCMSPIVK